MRVLAYRAKNPQKAAFPQTTVLWETRTLPETRPQSERLACANPCYRRVGGDSGQSTWNAPEESCRFDVIQK